MDSANSSRKAARHGPSARPSETSRRSGLGVASPRPKRSPTPLASVASASSSGPDDSVLPVSTRARREQRRHKRRLGLENADLAGRGIHFDLDAATTPPNSGKTAPNAGVVVVVTRIHRHPDGPSILI